MLEDATLTFDIGDKYPRNALVEGDNLYVSLWDYSGGVAKVVKIDLTTFSLVSTLTVSLLDGRTSGMVVSGNFLYVAVADVPGMLVKVDLTTFTVNNTLILSAPGQAMRVATDDTFVYVLPYGGASNIWKIAIATFTEVDFALTAIGAGGKHPLIHDGFLYYISGTILGKASTTPLAEVATLDLGVVSHDEATLARVGGFLYTTENGDPSRMCKVDLSTFTKIDELTLSSTNARDIVVVGSNLYTCHYFSNKIIEIDPSTLSETDSLTLSAAADYLNCMAHDSLYIGSRTSPGRVTKVTFPLVAPARKGNIVIDQLIYQHAERMRR